MCVRVLVLHIKRLTNTEGPKYSIVSVTCNGRLVQGIISGTHSYPGILFKV